ncbi:MAG: hypothetical protein KKF00_14595 [Proteobacteria bacterium]|nr:hypothetical protein [Pseudomonadota bacterium]
MFRIRRIFDDVVPANRHAIEQVSAILRSQFELFDRHKIDRISELLRHPLKYRFRSILYVAEDHRATVRGLALLDHDADLKFCYLDYLASNRRLAGRGVGGALYARVRSEALSLGVAGVFFECLPDDPKLCLNPDVLKQNRARLKFYEAYGARPIVNTAYETPVRQGMDNPPYLVFDDLAQNRVLRRSYLKRGLPAFSNGSTRTFATRITSKWFWSLCAMIPFDSGRSATLWLRPWRKGMRPLPPISPRSLLW